MTRIPSPHRPVSFALAVMVALLVTLAVPKPLTAQPEQSPTADTTISSKTQASDSEPHRAQPAPTPDKSDIDTDIEIQPTPAPARSGTDSATDVEIQRRFNELQRELLDHRVKLVDWWLTAMAIFLTLLGVVAVIAGYFSFQRFREIEGEARQSVKTAEEYAKASEEYERRAGGVLREIEAKRDEAESLHGEMESRLRDMNAETTHNDPDKASEVVETVQQNPAASLTDRAVADATLLQQQGKGEAAIEKWHSIANVAGAADTQLQARAWFSIGYLHGKEDDWEAAIDAYDKAADLAPDASAIYNNRGHAKNFLGLYEAALADSDKAVELAPDIAEVYDTRGVAKAGLGRYEEAREDYQKALALAQKSGREDLIAMVQKNLSRLDNDKAS